MHICNLAQYAGGERCSFGLIFILFPLKIAGGNNHGFQGKSPPPPPMAHSDSHEVLMLYLQKSPRNKLLLLLSDESCLISCS